MNEGRFTRGAAGVALALGLSLIGSQSAAAQAYRYGAGWVAGVELMTELNASALGISLEPELGPVFGIQLERGYGSTTRFVVRYQGSYQAPHFDWAGGTARSIDALSGDVSVLYRPLDPREGGVLPYVMAGLGGIWYDMGRGRVTSYTAAGAFHDGESRVLPLAAFGVGTDIPIGITWDTYPVLIRVEAADHMTFWSPLFRLSDGDAFGPVHHLRFTVGARTAVDLIP